MAATGGGMLASMIEHITALGALALIGFAIGGCAGSGSEPATAGKRAAAATTPAATGQGKLALVEESESGLELVTMDADGGGRATLDQLDALEVFNPGWSPDGDRIVYEYYTEDPRPHAGVIVANADGSEPKDLTPKGLQGQPAFTPDGKRIVLEREQGGNGVWIMDADGSHAKRVTRNPFAGGDACGCDTDPNVSPDGRTVTFVRVKEDGVTAALFAVDIDGSRPRQLTPFEWNVAVKHDWSPDGSRIAITREGDTEEGGSANVVLIDPDGGNAQPLTEFTDGRRAYVGSFSPDGERIVYRLEDDEGFALAVMAADGGDIQEISRSADVKPRFIDWGP